MTKKDLCLNEESKHILSIGAPIGLQEFLTQISFMALCAFVNRLGLSASSGYGVANKIVAFVMLVPSSIMQSMASFVSQNVGAGNEKRAKQAMLTGMSAGIAIGIVISILITFHGDFVSKIFTSDASVIAKSAEYLKGFAPEAVVTAILFSFIGYFNGHGKTVFIMFQGIAQTFLVRLPVSYIMSIQSDANLTNIGLAAPSATIFGIIINLVFFIIYNRQLKKGRI